MAKSAKTKATKPSGTAAAARGYVHADATLATRPEVGAAPRFRDKRPPTQYRYDSSLSPSLEWDDNPAREQAEFLLTCIEEAARLAPPQVFPAPRHMTGADGRVLLSVTGLQDALSLLRRLQAPFLNWTGKAERAGFEVPALPLFVHERLSTQAIIETLEGHRKQNGQADLFSLFADPARTAYRSAKNEAMLARHGLVSRIHRKKPQGLPMPERTRRANARKLMMRSKVEHVFAHQKGLMGLAVRSIGIARARVKIGLVNLAYNICRFVWLSGRTAPA